MLTFRLTVNLCQPTIIAWNGKHPLNNEEWQIYFDAEEKLTKSLPAFIDSSIFKIFAYRAKTYFDQARLTQISVIIHLQFSFIGMGR